MIERPLDQRMSQEQAIEKAKGIAKSLEDSLTTYLRQPKGDPETLDNVQYIVANLANALAYTASADAGKTREDDLDAVMRGVGMMLDPARDIRNDNDETHPRAANRFRELVDTRFRYLGPQ